jgi:hypothetical protein
MLVEQPDGDIVYTRAHSELFHLIVHTVWRRQHQSHIMTSLIIHLCTLPRENIDES